jgi:hypothetical protein
MDHRAGRDVNIVTAAAHGRWFFYPTLDAAAAGRAEVFDKLRRIGED